MHHWQLDEELLRIVDDGVVVLTATPSQKFEHTALHLYNIVKPGYGLPYGTLCSYLEPSTVPGPPLPQDPPSRTIHFPRMTSSDSSTFCPPSTKPNSYQCCASSMPTATSHSNIARMGQLALQLKARTTTVGLGNVTEYKLASNMQSKLGTGRWERM